MTATAPGALMDQAAEAVRALNRATRSTGEPGWESPADAVTVVVGLVALVDQLPVALERVAAHVEQLRDAKHVHGGSTDDRVAETRVRAQGAQIALNRVSTQLGAMRSALVLLALEADQ